MGACATLALLAGAGAAWRPEVEPYKADDATALLLHLDGSVRDASARGAAVEGEGEDWLQPGVIGGALRCDGKTLLTAPAPKGLADGFTVEAWVRLKRPDKDTRYVLARLPNCFEAGFDVSPGGRSRPYLRASTDRGRYSAISYQRIPLGRWVHVAFVYRPQVKKEPPLEVYIQGEFVRYRKRPKDWMAKGTLRAGKGPMVLMGGLVGDVDELRVSTKPRTPKEFICPWFSGRWGDYEPFRPGAANAPPPGGWDAKRPWLTAAEAVPTLNSIGLYVRFAHDGDRNAKVRVRFRDRAAGAWSQGMDLVRAAKGAEFRGSLLLLKPDTEYEIELRAEDPDGVAAPGNALRLTQRTWREEVPIGEVRALPAGVIRKPVTIRAKGKPDAWVLYAPPKGATTTIDVGLSAPHALIVDDSAYVIIERLTIRGGSEHGTLLTESHHVRVRRCEMTDWGQRGKRNAKGLWVRKAGGVLNCQDAIRLGLNTRRIVVEDNYIHTPRGTSTCWRFGHPVGPQVTTLGYNESRNNVIRNNEMLGAEGHWFNDIIGSTGNGSTFGGPYRDTDMNGNFLAYSQDNAVELDGGQMNVRFWNNRMEHTYRTISFAPCILGPGYAFDNLIAHTGDEFFRAGTQFKTGANARNFGLDLVFFNTVVGPAGAGLKNSPKPYTRRDNYMKGDRWWYVQSNVSARPGAYFDPSDPWQKRPAKDMFVFEDAVGADYRLRAGSPGVNAGGAVAGFPRVVKGKAPDLGIFEQGVDTNAFMPRRPWGIEASPQHVAVTATSGRATADKAATVTLSAPKSAGATWRARVNSPWLVCSPETGPTGAPARVTISCDASKLAPYLHRGVVTFRTDLGLNRSLTVDVKVLHPRAFVRFFEAEKAPATGAFRIGKDASASGGQYAHAPTKAPASLTFAFEAPEKGDYYVLGRLLTPEGRYGGFRYSLDGSQPELWIPGAKRIPFWKWDRLRPHERKRTRTTARGFQLDKGKHTFVLTARKPGTRLDCLVVSNQPYIPAPEVAAASRR